MKQCSIFSNCKFHNMFDKKMEKINNPLESEIYKVNPAFSFRYLIQGDYDLDSKLAKKDLRLKVLNKLRQYSQQSWTDLRGQSKYNGGIEIIELQKLKNRKVKIPNKEFYNQINEVVIFRLSGKNSGRIVGYRSGIKKTCYILWIDWNFKSYNHGS